MKGFRRVLGSFWNMGNGIFATDETGTTVFFPSGLLRQGYVVTAEQEAAIRRFLTRYNAAVFVVPIVGARLFGLAILILAVPAAAIYWWWSRRVIAGLPLSPFRMTSIEAQHRSIRLHGRLSLIVLLAFSLALTVGGVAILWSGAVLEGLLAVALFGYATFRLSSLLIRNRHYSPEPIGRPRA